MVICWVNWCNLLCFSNCCNFGWLINIILRSFLWLVFKLVSKCNCFNILGNKCWVLFIISIVLILVWWFVVNLFKIRLVKYFKLVWGLLYVIFNLLYIVVSNFNVDKVGFKIIVICVLLGNCCSSFFDMVVFFVLILLVSIMKLLFLWSLNVKCVNVFLCLGFI